MFFIAGELWAQSPEELMNQGNKQYQNSNYQEAIETYRQIVSQGYESTALYYNLGNAYFKQNELGLAILYYEKALELSPGDEDILHNLEIANARTVDEIEQVPQLFIFEWWDSLLAALTVSGWTLVVTIFYVVLLSLIGLYLLTKSFILKKNAFIGAAVVLVLLIFSATVMAAKIHKVNSEDYGVLIEDTVTAKVSPDSKSSDAFVIHEGIKFEIEDNLDEWRKIRLADGKVGWIPQNSFGEI
jgi:tetratricopeptide (TPR) repeat protein